MFSIHTALAEQSAAALDSMSTIARILTAGASTTTATSAPTAEQIETFRAAARRDDAESFRTLVRAYRNGSRDALTILIGGHTRRIRSIAKYAHFADDEDRFHAAVVAFIDALAPSSEYYAEPIASDHQYIQQAMYYRALETVTRRASDVSVLCTDGADGCELEQAAPEENFDAYVSVEAAVTFGVEHGLSASDASVLLHKFARTERVSVRSMASTSDDHPERVQTQIRRARTRLRKIMAVHGDDFAAFSVAFAARAESTHDAAAAVAVVDTSHASDDTESTTLDRANDHADAPTASPLGAESDADRDVAPASSGAPVRSGSTSSCVALSADVARSLRDATVSIGVAVGAHRGATDAPEDGAEARERRVAATVRDRGGREVAPVDVKAASSSAA